MYLFISPSDSISIHPANTNTDFIFELTKPLLLEGVWSFGLVAILFDNKQTENLYIYCDLVDCSVVHDKSAPLLRIVKKSEEYSYPLYLPITRNTIERIRFTVKNIANKITPVKGAFTLIAHLKREC